MSVSSVNRAPGLAPVNPAPGESKGEGAAPDSVFAALLAMLTGQVAVPAPAAAVKSEGEGGEGSGESPALPAIPVLPALPAIPFLTGAPGEANPEGAQLAALVPAVPAWQVTAKEQPPVLSGLLAGTPDLPPVTPDLSAVAADLRPAVPAGLPAGPGSVSPAVLRILAEAGTPARTGTSDQSEAESPRDLPVFDLAAAAAGPAPGPASASIRFATAAAGGEQVTAQAALPVHIDQLAGQITRTARSEREGEYTLSLRLYPEHLGEVTLQLRLIGREVQARFEAVTPEARQALEARSEQLRQNLEQAGLSLSGFDVSTGSGGRSPGERQAFAEFFPGRRAPRPQAAGPAPAAGATAAGGLRSAAAGRGRPGAFDTMA